jgi:NAD(P)-dependent dehydrogenase (short-subunit alcohol dehydrogenase family)
MEDQSPVALVTGAASGLGRSIVLKLAEGGYRVAATIRDISRLEELHAEADRLGLAERIEWFHLDVTHIEQADQLVADMGSRFGRLDVLVNNAGLAVGGFTEEVKLEDWRKQMETNFFGVVNLTRAVLPLMRRQQRGKIIQISSISGRMGFPGLGPYVASKYALEGFSESLRLELLPFGIHVVLVEPGSYRTDIWGKALATLPQGDASPYRELSDRLVKLTKASASKAGDPAEVSDLVLRIVRHPSPRLRYPIGKGVRQSILAKTLLPWSWIERQVMKMLRK